MIFDKALPNWLSWLPLGKVPAITPEQAAQSMEQYLFVDVRTQLEYKKNHIPGAISLPLQQLTTPRIRQLPTDKPIVCICLSAHRSKPATRKLIKAGLDTRELEGGMLAWWKFKLPTEASQ
ncbi:rhodanese-like domain-containing protein [Amphritea japonica]|uniref:Sulfurtransferase n=1 Tax=Amphritea japonica ATCC BAA-1530 TaxID=1278309 RepID=A0A7R6SRL4_9GAMM|nr:rhodanese-like domain-containing protein [Amphritea japonica]BBB25364.1 sulfurtransferase [Amphritea japonica ATCC BAA-1530]